MTNERGQPVMTVSSCGCLIRRIGKNTYDMEYCPKHEAVEDMYEALKAWDKYLDTGPPQNLTFKEKAWHLTEQALAKAEGKDAK